MTRQKTAARETMIPEVFLDFTPHERAVRELRDSLTRRKIKKNLCLDQDNNFLKITRFGIGSDMVVV